MTNEVSFTRKIKEALLALKIERTYSKDKILELYLNEIYLGLGAYGIAAASLVYFDKSVNELTIPEAAYLAALPKAPNNYHPFRQRERALERRNWVIDQMAEDGFIKAADAEKAKRTPLGVTQKPTERAHVLGRIFRRGSAARTLRSLRREEALRRRPVGAHHARHQAAGAGAQDADRRPGAVTTRRTAGAGRSTRSTFPATGASSSPRSRRSTMSRRGGWRWCWKSSDQSARIGLQPGREPGGYVSKERDIGILPLDGVKWAKINGRKPPSKVSQVLDPGDVVYVEPAERTTGNTACTRCRKSPAPWWWRIPGPGACSPWSAASPTTRASSTARRRRCASPAPRSSRSSMRPRSTTATRRRRLLLDAPIEIDQGPGLGVWKPENYEGNFFGPSTLRFGIEHSRNVMTVRLAQDVGMPLIAEYAKRFGVYDSLPPYLSFALGAGETTLLRMVTAYAMIDNGGRRVKPTLIDRIQDRYGHTVYRHDERECIGCDAKKWANQPEPSLIDRREQVLDPMTAYQITSMMEGVVQRGTAAGVGFQQEVGKPVAGKTGTTNDYKDAWFIGFTPDIVAGVYIGYDKPRTLGRGETGGRWRRRW